jgi:hypothetical protein
MKGNNLNNVRYKTSRHIREKRRKYLNDKIKSKSNKNIWDLNTALGELRRIASLRLVCWRKLMVVWMLWTGGEKLCTSVIYWMHFVKSLRHNNGHTTEPVVPEPSNCEVEIFYLKVIVQSSRNYPSNGLIPVTEICELLILWNKLEFHSS